MAETRFVPVVCALIERDGLVLIAQRPAHKHLGLMWEFPGGKVEAGEDPSAALKREIREELGCGLELVHVLPTRRHTYDRIAIAMTPFVARLSPGCPEPTPREHIALAWVAPADLNCHHLAPADVPVVADYHNWLSARRSAPVLQRFHSPPQDRTGATNDQQ